MKNKNTIKQLVTMMEEAQEAPQYIIGWLTSMIDGNIKHGYTMQESIDSGIKFYQDKALLAGRMKSLQKVANEARPEELYA